MSVTLTMRPILLIVKGLLSRYLQPLALGERSRYTSRHGLRANRVARCPQHAPG